LLTATAAVMRSLIVCARISPFLHFSALYTKADHIPPFI
jgi:hypothetical protein